MDMTQFIRVHKDGFLSYEEIMVQFPFAVYHAAKWNTLKWYAMRAWLNTHVGPHDVAWTWILSDQVRFVRESDAILFSLSWE